MTSLPKMGNKWWRAFKDANITKGCICRCALDSLDILLVDCGNCEGKLPVFMKQSGAGYVYLARDGRPEDNPWAKPVRQRMVREDLSEVDLSVSSASVTPFNMQATMRLGENDHKVVKSVAEQYKDCDFQVNGEEAPGEAEHKMIRHLYKLQAQGRITESTRIGLCSNDGDVLLLALQVPFKHVYLFRNQARTIVDIDRLRHRLAARCNVEEESIHVMCEDLSAVLSALENDYLPALTAAENFSIKDILVILRCMYAADPDLHAFEDGRVNATFFEHFFMYMACVVGDYSTSSPDGRSRAKDYLETIAWLFYTNRGECPSDLQYYPCRDAPTLGDISDSAEHIGIAPDAFPQGHMTIPWLNEQLPPLIHRPKPVSNKAKEIVKPDIPRNRNNGRKRPTCRQRRPQARQAST